MIPFYITASEITKSGTWIGEDGTTMSILDMEFEEGIPVLMYDANQLIHKCPQCGTSSEHNVALLLDSDRHVYFARCCGRIMIMKVEKNE